MHLLPFVRLPLLVRWVSSQPSLNHWPAPLTVSRGSQLLGRAEPSLKWGVSIRKVGAGHRLDCVVTVVGPV